MLVDLKVKNFVLIDELEINFDQGLNVITGETGAGKSIIIGALDMLLVSRASTDVIRQGQEVTYIEAAYQPAQLKTINQLLVEAGIEPDSDLVLLSREIKQNGPNRCRINGQLATLNMVKSISKYLIDIHGQHEHQLLLNPAEHLHLLDDFLSEDKKNLKDEVKALYQDIKDLEDQLKNLQIDEGEKARQLDMLDFQINEIKAASLKEDEQKKLMEEYKILSNMEEIYSVTGQLVSELNGDDYEQNSLVDKLGILMGNLESVKDFSADLNNFHQAISDVFYQLQELSFDIENYHQQLEYNEARLQEIEKRLDTIHSLQRKYGKTIAEILAYLDKIENKRQLLQDREDLIIKLKKQKKELLLKYNKKAENLSRIRKKQAARLEAQIKKEFVDLALEDTVLKVDFSRKEISENGIDRIEFLISTNPGEDLKQLSRVVSGGELSRIMLALKTIIADIDKVDTLIFDEADSGVGGKTAQKMAEKMFHIAQKRQTICITHLPQIASMADAHFLIKKETKNDSTYTDIKKLDEQQRKFELARMLGGAQTTETALQHAREMLMLAQERK